MPRIRTLKPEFWSSEDLSQLPESAHILAAALLNYADDHGYFNANVALVRAACFPIRTPNPPIETCLSMLVEVDYLRLGDGPSGKRYGHIVNFEKHQVVNKKKPTRIGCLPIVWDSYRSDTGQIPDESHEEGKGRERKGTKTPHAGGDGLGLGVYARGADDGF